MEEDSPDIDLTSGESDFALDEFEDDVSSSEEVGDESQSEVELDPDLDLRHANPWVRTYSPEDRPNPDHEFDEDCGGPRDAPGDPGFDPRCGRPLPTGWVGVSIM